MLWIKESIGEVLEKLDTDAAQGLSPEAAQKRLEKYGPNEFEEGQKETLFRKVLHHLTDITVIILIAAAAVAAYMAATQDDGWAKVIVILAIVVINVTLGTLQESRAEKALDALKKMNSFNTTVIRGGVKMVADATELVPGDIIELSAGDVITADARLIEGSSLQVEEAALTGESEPVDKDPNAAVTGESVPLGDRLNMVYSGCLVTGGRARAVVVETAMETELGKIARMLNTTKKQKTPLQIRLTQLAKRISITALGAGVVMFLLGVLVFGNDATVMLLAAVALGVAAVPETLPIIVTMILSHGVYNMVTKKTIIRKIPAVETVGNTSVICSDKTGTLTQNKMRIQRVWRVDRDPVAAKDPFGEGEICLLELLAACSNATIEAREDEGEHVVGDPTEIAIIRLLHDKGLTRVDVERDYPRVHELPFDSGRKRMTTVHRTPDGGFLAVTKGAFDRIPVDWDEVLLKKATEIHDSFADQALRVIAIACKSYDGMPADLSIEALEKGMNFLGMVGMIDPPRPESQEAVALAKEAGIRTVMITGDHVGTAAAIAKEIGILTEGGRAITGAELSKMSEEELRDQVKDICVYARVSPEDKIRIVQAWQAHGEVAAMTGDGVNDAPALKAADIGVAMGITGTEVSKSAADMIITDDNFATIVDAIAEGRTSYDNVRKIVSFLLSVNFAEIAILLLGMVVSFVLLGTAEGAGLPPITALQILLINTVCDGIPGFFLAFEKTEEGIMKRKPLSKGAGIFAAGFGWRIAQRSVMFVIFTLAAYTIGAAVRLSPAVTPSHTVGVTMAFAVLAWASIINIFNVRSTTESIFKIGFLSNKGVFFAAMGTIAFTAAVLLAPPIASVFEVDYSLSGWHWVIMIMFAALQLFVVELIKLAERKRARV
ncbi:MAG: cation-translocating P-type ATPase [Clostridiales bacterium]|nr:cation-translocating P-type ATPase [Clostridiales bacterium]